MKSSNSRGNRRLRIVRGPAAAKYDAYNHWGGSRANGNACFGGGGVEIS